MEEDDKLPNPKRLEIYQKGMEIFEITKNVLDLIPDDADEMLKDQAGWMMENASILSMKVAGAEAAELYDIKMECATIIRKSARELVTNCHGLEMFGFKDTQYFDLIRNAVEEYRLLFIVWIATFDKWDYVIDRWGLFNPPGVGPFDKDPDDDIPWDGPDEGL